jgi:hypothetical protein
VTLGLLCPPLAPTRLPTPTPPDPTPPHPTPPPPQERIRNDIIEWLRYLKTVGFDGWRFDFVRGYNGQFVKMYVDATVRRGLESARAGRGPRFEPARRTICDPCAQRPPHPRAAPACAAAPAVAAPNTPPPPSPPPLPPPPGSTRPHPNRCRSSRLASTGTPASTPTACSTTTRWGGGEGRGESRGPPEPGLQRRRPRRGRGPPQDAQISTCRRQIPCWIAPPQPPPPSPLPPHPPGRPPPAHHQLDRPDRRHRGGVRLHHQGHTAGGAGAQRAVAAGGRAGAAAGHAGHVVRRARRARAGPGCCSGGGAPPGTLERGALSADPCGCTPFAPPSPLTKARPAPPPGRRAPSRSPTTTTPAAPSTTGPSPATTCRCAGAALGGDALGAAPGAARGCRAAWAAGCSPAGPPGGARLGARAAARPPKPLNALTSPTTPPPPQEGYAYILLHPGTPCVFVDHIDGDGNLRKVGGLGWSGSWRRGAGNRRCTSSRPAQGVQTRQPRPPPTHLKPNPPHPDPPQLILDLIKVRQTTGLNARSKVTVRKAAADVYAATIDDKVG